MVKRARYALTSAYTRDRGCSIYHRRAAKRSSNFDAMAQCWPASCEHGAAEIVHEMSINLRPWSSVGPPAGEPSVVRASGPDAVRQGCPDYAFVGRDGRPDDRGQIFRSFGPNTGGFPSARLAKKCYGAASRTTEPLGTDQPLSRKAQARLQQWPAHAGAVTLTPLQYAQLSNPGTE
jgi:hypothetical protein